VSVSPDAGEVVVKIRLPGTEPKAALPR
jgi:hypothetical protein